MLRTMTFKKITLGVALGAGLLGMGSASFAQNLLTVNNGFETALSLNPTTAEIGFLTDYDEVAFNDTAGNGGLFISGSGGTGRFSVTTDPFASDLHFAAVDNYVAAVGDNFFMANGSEINDTLWQYATDVAITDDTRDYLFSGYVSVWSPPSIQSVGPDLRPNFSFEIAESSDGVSFGSFVSLDNFFVTSTDLGTWEEKIATYTPTSGTVAVRLRVQDLSISGNGNDFGLDELQFQFQPVPATDGVTSLGIGGFVCLMGHLQIRRRKAAKAKKN